MCGGWLGNIPQQIHTHRLLDMDVGGLVGVISSSITNSYSTGSVIGYSDM